MKQLKILALSDTHCLHYQLNNWFKLNQELVNQADIIIYAGDSSNDRDELINLQEQLDFIDWYSKLEVSDNCIKIYVAGNHNTSEYILSDEIYEEKGITRLYNKSINVKGFNIFGSPYSQEFGYGWVYNYDRKDVSFWNIIPNETDIVITHGQAFNTLDMVYDTQSHLPTYKPVGDKWLLNRINEVKPKLVIGGHIHDNPSDYGYDIKNNGYVVKNGIEYHNVSIVDNNIEVVNIPHFITIYK